MTDILSVDNMRRSDAATIKGGISGRELMARAGKAIYESVKWKPPVAIVCGVGNNAGDGYVLARLLKDDGIECSLILLEDRFSEDGKYYFDKCLNDSSTSERNVQGNIKVMRLEEVENLSSYGTIVDCIFGTGFRGDVRGKAKLAIDMINTSGAYVVSVDINSGLNGDSGMCAILCSADESKDSLKSTWNKLAHEKETVRAGGSAASGTEGACVRSDITVSIGSFKPGHFLNMAKDVMKSRVNCDIGIRPVEKPYGLVCAEDLAEYFCDRKNFSNKGTYGYTAIIGGSKKYSGAVRLASMANSAVMNCAENLQKDMEAGSVKLLAEMANAAMRSGAGVVKVGLPDSLYHDLVPLILESTVFPLSDRDGELIFNKEEIDSLISNVRTVAFGMGIGLSAETGKCLEYLLEAFSGTLIVDADGLNLLSKMDRERIRRSKCRLVLTPHLKEFERLTGLKKEEILARPVSSAETYALDTGAVVLLKGPSTIVTDGVRTYIVEAGCSGMATAGSGDVLSGILSAVCGYIGDLPLAVAAGAYINGKAGEAAQRKSNSISMTAGDTVSCIAEVITGLNKR